MDEGLRRYWPSWRGVVLVAGIFLLAIFLVVAGLFWRLSRGPLDITPLSHLLPVMQFHDATHTVSAQLQWQRVRLSLHKNDAGGTGALSGRRETLLQLDVDGLVLRRMDGVEPAALEHAGLAVAVRSLLHGQVIVRDAVFSGAHGALYRDDMGRIGFRKLRGTPFFEPQDKEKQSSSVVARLVRGLHEVSLRDITFSIRNREMPDVTFALSEAHVSHHLSGEWDGQLQATLHAGVETAQIEAQMTPIEKGESHWSLTMTPLTPAHLAAWVPVGVLAQFQLPVGGSAEGVIRPDDSAAPVPQASFRLHLGEGQIIPKPGTRSVRIVEADIQGHFERFAKAITVGIDVPSLVMRDSANVPVPAALVMNAQWNPFASSRTVEVDFHVHMPRFDFATLDSIWPEAARKGGRRWIVQNITEGRGENLALHVHLHGANGWSHLQATQMEGDLYGHGLSVTWLHPLPPVTGVEAHAFFVTSDLVQIDLTHGRMADGLGGNIQIPSGMVRLSSLLEKDQYGDIRLELDGALPSFLKILAHPRLRLLSRHPLTVTHPKGEVTGHLDITLPLESTLTMAEIGFNATAIYRNVALDSKWLGKVRQGKGALGVNSDGITVHGASLLDGIPVTIDLVDHLVSGPPGHMIRRFTATGRVNQAVLKRLGVSLPSGMLQGNLLLKGECVETALEGQHRHGVLDLYADLTPAGLITPVWTKTRGTPVHMSVHTDWHDGKLTQLDRLHAEGRGIVLSGRAVIKGHNLAGMRLDHVRLGRSEARVALDWPVSGYPSPYRVNIAAGVVDMAPWLAARHAAHARRADKQSGQAPVHLPHGVTSPFLPAGEWNVTLKAAKVLYAPQKALPPVALNLAWNNRRLWQASVSVAAPLSVALDMQPDSGKAAYRLHADVENVGHLLEEVVDYHRMEGGALHLEGVFASDGRDLRQGLGFGLGLPPFRGRVVMRQAVLRHPPAFMKAATLFAPLHWGQIKRDRFEDITLLMDLSVHDEILTVHEGQIGNAVLGGTFRGTWNVPYDVLAVRGTVSPLHQINSAPGAIPGIGRLFAPEKGSGLMAMTYSLDGTVENPAVHVNPFAVFLPGVLRRILE